MNVVSQYNQQIQYIVVIKIWCVILNSLSELFKVNLYTNLHVYTSQLDSEFASNLYVYDDLYGSTSSFSHFHGILFCNDLVCV